MTDLVLAGDPRSALAHLAPVGLASILRDSGDRGARSWWDLDTARPCVRSSLPVDEIGQAVIRHASQRANDSWLTARRGASPKNSLFSPRVTVPADEWTAYVARRDDALAENPSTLTPLDYRMLTALGQPAWWLAGYPKSGSDDGASRWDE